MSSKVNPNIKLKVMKKYGFKCVYCNHEGSNSNFLTVDHVYPIKHGGTNSQKNLACSCLKCNQIKAEKLLTDFIKECNIPVTEKIARFL